MRRVLFVDDESKILDGLRRMLHAMRRSWETRFAIGGQAALEELAEWQPDVVVTDMRMPGIDGAALLEQVARRWPAVIRMVLSGQTDDEAAARAIPVAHQFIMKPCAGPVLCSIIDRACSLRDLLGSSSLREMVGTVDTLPPAPGTYVALGIALRSASTSVDDIAAVIQRDAALTAKLLQLVNSAFFGPPREVSSISQAVALLGAGRIRSLALAHEIFGGGHVAGRGLALEQEQEHALAVAALAQEMVETRAEVDAVLTAGLLHDVGKLILAGRPGGEFQADLERSRREQRPLHSIEREVRGVTHAEVGAYLLGLWGLPHVVVEAVAHHHTSEQLPEEGRRIAAATQVADALVNEARGGAPLCIAPELLDTLGGPDRLAEWRVLLTQATR